MIKVYQTKFGKGKGNCLQACVASILELKLEEAPVTSGFDTHQEQVDSINKYLAKFKKKLWFSTDPEDVPKNIYCLVSGHSWRCRCGKKEIEDDGNHMYHTCVGFSFKGDIFIIHDPHPATIGSANGIIETKGFTAGIEEYCWIVDDDTLPSDGEA